MDAIDETLDLFRSESEHGRRNRRVVALGIASAVAAWIAHHAILGDVDTHAWVEKGNADSSGGWDWAGTSGALFLLAPFVVYSAVYERESVLRFVVGTLAIPLVVLATGLVYLDDAKWQKGATDLFARYTERFPPGRLHGEYVPRQNDRFVIVCANEGRQDGGQQSRVPRNKQFCIEAIVGDDRRRKVDGGFRFFADDGAEYGFTSHDFFDCFGDAVYCGE